MARKGMAFKSELQRRMSTMRFQYMHLEGPHVEEARECIYEIITKLLNNLLQHETSRLLLRLDATTSLWS